MEPQNHATASFSEPDLAANAPKPEISETSLDVNKNLEALSQSPLLDHDLLKKLQSTQNVSEFLTEVACIEIAKDTAQNTEIMAMLYNLGFLCRDRYDKNKNLQDIDAAVGCYTQLTLRMGGRDAGWPSVLNSLGDSHRERSELTGDPSDLYYAIGYSTQALSCTSSEDPQYSTYLTYLGHAYMARFRSVGQLPDLDLALQCHFQAASFTPDQRPDKPNRLSILGSAYYIRYECLGQIADLNEAINHQKQTTILVSNEDPDKPSYLKALGGSCLTRYKQTGELTDLDWGIELQVQAISLMSNEHIDKPGALSNLGTAYHSQYERVGDPSIIEKAIRYHQQAVALAPDGNLNKPGYLNNLGIAHYNLYEHLGRLSDLDSSITLKKQAVDLTPNSSPMMATRLSNLGNSYEVRFERLNEISDLDTAIEHKSQAVVLTPDGDPNKASRLHNLGTAHYARHTRLGHLKDLERAISTQVEAVELTPDTYPSKAVYLNSLGSSYHSLYKQLHNLPDLELALDSRQLSVQITPNGHPTMFMRLRNLADAYYSRFLHLSNTADSDLAISYMRLAVSAVPDGHLEQLRIIGALGDLFHGLYLHSSNEDYLTESIDCFRQATCLKGGHPYFKQQAARMWSLLCRIRQPQAALEAYQHFMSLIPQVVWLGMAVEQRYEATVEIADVTLEAAVTAIKFQKYNQALEWLEQGRSIVWNQLVQLRSPLNKLRLFDEALAKKLQDVAQELSGSASLKHPTIKSISTGPSLESTSQRHRRVAEQWEILVQEVQLHPEMNGFLAPIPASRLVFAPSVGAVVTVICHSHGCGALIMQPYTTHVEYIDLQDISFEDLMQASIDPLQSQLPETRMNRKIVYSPVLTTSFEKLAQVLWKGIAKPVLNFLGYTDYTLSLENRPRITWCTTGPLSQLPIHAAGDYSQPYSTLADYVVSCYTPTLSTLILTPGRSTQFTGIAMISQEHTLGFPDLPGTKEELNRIIQKAHDVSITRLDGVHASQSAVLDAMEQHGWLHLACHASQNLTNPAASAFYLSDGPLDLAAITQKNLQNADLAFLSACQTATGDKRLSEESIHLAAGMVMAGYRTVIATMWPIDDRDAPLVAERFYEYILNNQSTGTNDFARALQYAVGCLREQVGINEFWRWAPYIHMGQ